jgi:DNA-binding CsgD family transcriptional regulator
MSQSADTGRPLLSDDEWQPLARTLSLSARQAEICRLILSGASDKQIASNLRIAVPTVRTHISRTFVKLGLQDRFELMSLVFRNVREKCKKCPNRQRYLH